VPEVWLDDENDDRLSRLENDADPARKRLAERVNEELRRIARDPGHASVRRHRFQSVDAWVVTVRGEEEDWAILWRPHETEPDVILVAYFGPASFV
jgi:hypothetical protein